MLSLDFELVQAVIRALCRLIREASRRRCAIVKSGFRLASPKYNSNAPALLISAILAAFLLKP